MITDQSALTDIRSEWGVVHKTCDMIARNLAASSFGIGSVGPSHQYRNFGYNLCLLFAFSVLEHALLQLRDEGVFSSSKSNLGALMDAGKKALPWQNFVLVDRGRETRNDIAHKRAFIEREECWKYLAAIEAELLAWKILV